MQFCQWSGPDGGTVTAYVCRDCEYALRGQEPPEPDYWPTGEPVPTLSDGVTHILICGICRRALYDGELTQAMRLAAEDVIGLDIVPGNYASCPRCIAFFQPAIRERLVEYPEQAGLTPEQVDRIPAILYGDWLQ